MKVLFKCALVVLSLGVLGPAPAQGEAPPAPTDLGKLVTAVESLVNVLEHEARARAEDREAQRIQVLVSILSLRYRKTDDLESEIREIESEEENVRSGLSTMKARLEALDPPGSPEESAPAENKTVRKFLEIEAKSAEDHLAKLEERKMLAQNELAAARKRLTQLESTLEEWMAKPH